MYFFSIWFLMIFMLHNLEEIITVESWMKKTYPRVKQRIPAGIQKEIDKMQDMTAARFAVVVFILSAMVSVLLALTMWYGKFFVFLGINLIFAVNIFTHPLQALYLRCYTPGLWTTVLLIIPYYVLFFYYTAIAGLWHVNTLLSSIVILILFIPLFLFSHKIGEKVAARL